MQKTVLAALLALSTAQAALPPADCKSLLLGDSNMVRYTSAATFPNEPQQVTVWFDEATGPTKFCGFTFTPTQKGQVVTATAPNLAAFSNVFRENYRNTQRIMFENMYRDTSAGTANPTSNAVFDPRNYQLTYEAPGYNGIPFTVGAKIDNGALQPLYYNGKASAIRVPRSARTIDIYAKVGTDIATHWQRVSINLPRATVTIYKKATFPAK
ncbi:hypothetical protein [Deinococcus aestuarii]|uniref:hypothetical protein n=1 Tax=Deinococcus aestuarii TaxID=2774531 RepID=UPI001C0DA2EE|nr:hypothetical protein [Deinococcus aestuarii]